MLKSLVSFFVGMMISSFALAEEVAKSATPSTPAFGEMLSQMLLVLGLVVGLLLAIAWVLRRAGVVQGSANGRLRVLGGVSVGPRERVLLIQVGQEQLVVGVTAAEVSLLHLMTDPIDFSEASSPSLDDSGLKGFAQKLQDALKKRQQP